MKKNQRENINYFKRNINIKASILRTKKLMHLPRNRKIQTFLYK